MLKLKISYISIYAYVLLFLDLAINILDTW